MHGLLQDLAISLIVATILGLIAYRLNQPIILGYFLAGIVVGPKIGPQLVNQPTNINLISEIGLILLLFVIGLEIDIPALLSSGKSLWMAGLGQFPLSVALGVGFFLLIGFNLNHQHLDNLYLAIACALSSTAIVVKLLYDKFELGTLPGKATLGILIFQDLWAILALAILPSFRTPQLSLIGIAILKSLALMGFGLLLSRHVLAKAYAWAEKSPEMVVAISLAWCALISGAAGLIGSSTEMGALIAGICISTFPYSIHVTSKVLPLRDVFLTLFFLSLGMKITIPHLHDLYQILEIVLFVIASRFLIVYPLLSWSGGGRRTSFTASLNLSQISEFSLVIATLGVSFGHIHKDILTLLIFAMVFTSVISTYFIKFSDPLFFRFNRLLNRLIPERPSTQRELGEIKRYSIYFLGCHLAARSLLEKLSKNHPELLRECLVIDFSVEMLRELEKMGVAGVFGDLRSLETLEHARIKDAKIILSTVSDMLLKGTSNLKLVKTCRLLAPQATVIATAMSASHGEKLKQAGASEVVVPYSLTGEHLLNLTMHQLTTDPVL